MDFSRIKYKRSESSEDDVITIWRKNIYQKDYVAQNVIVDVAQNVSQSSTEKKRLAEVLTLVATMKHITQKEIAERLCECIYMS